MLIYERVSQNGNLQVSNGLIKNLKVLGLTSSNGRRYLRKGIEAAARLYEGIAVNVNHPTRPNDPRSVYDRLGQLVNVRVKDDGLYADLKYLTSHSVAGLLEEAAQRMPGMFGLSHVASGRDRHVNGETVIESIEEVKSVDLVADPATVKGLFEQRGITQLAEQKSMVTEQETQSSIKQNWIDQGDTMETLMTRIVEDVDAKRPLSMPDEQSLRKVLEWIKDRKVIMNKEALEHRTMRESLFEKSSSRITYSAPIREKRTTQLSEQTRRLEDVRERLKPLPTDREELKRALFS